MNNDTKRFSPIFLLIALLAAIATLLYLRHARQQKHFTSADASLSNEQRSKLQAELTALKTAATDKLRVVWSHDPAHEATIAWNQRLGEPAQVYYDTTDHGTDTPRYAHQLAPQRVQPFHGMTNCFAKLDTLASDTTYYFVLKDRFGTSRRYQFHTAPDSPQPFTFVAGGDSRNGREARRLGNSLVPKLKPLFIAFTGDMIDVDDAPSWQLWFDDFQLTIADDGTITPIVAHRGNHEAIPLSVHHLFNTPKDAYFAFDIGGKLCRYYALNSMLPALGEQGKWLTADLEQNATSTTHLLAGYHHPMRPHVAEKPEGIEPYKWAPLFYQYGLDLAIESDSHAIKRTLPLKPDPSGDHGFTPAQHDPQATVYIGEGCWGAPLRSDNDAKSWTLDSASFNGFDWICVSPESIQVRTVHFDTSAKAAAVSQRNGYNIPAGLSLWIAKGGRTLTIPAD